MPKQNPKPRSLRAQAFEESNYPVEVEGTRCVEIRVPNADEFLPQLAGIIALAGKRFNYQNKDVERAKIIAEMWQAAYLENDWESCMNCEELIECLAPFFEDVLAKLDAIQSTTNSIAETTTNIFNTQNNNLAKLPITPEVEISGIYAGALELVRQMDKNNRKYYAEAEASFVDNASEALSIVLELFPKFRDAPYDEGFELGNAYFENQVTAYNTDYPDFEVPAAFDLYCRITKNADELTIGVWGDWLFGVTSVTVDPNAAGKVFTKYSPLRQTFLNQIAAFFNREASLQSYFEDLWQIYFAGTKAPVPLPDGYSCPEEWVYEWDFSEGDVAEIVGPTFGVDLTYGVQGYQGTIVSNYGGLSVGFNMHVDIPPGIAIQKWQFDCYRSNPNTALNPDRFGNYGSGMAGTLVNYTDYATEGAYTHEYVADLVTTEDDWWQYDLQVDNSGVSASLIFRQYAWRLYGFGPLPALSGGRFITTP